jgi:hypothetical protein
MSHKVLPSQGKNRTFFYKSAEIRFKELVSRSVVKPEKRTIVIEDDPWRAIKDAEVGKLIDRLEDRPEELYEAIRRRNRKKNKFTLLAGEEHRENGKMLEAIEAKRRYYETEFRTLLRNRKSEAINILLPKLETVHYIFNDKLHKLKKMEKSTGTPAEY